MQYAQQKRRDSLGTAIDAISTAEKARTVDPEDIDTTMLIIRGNSLLAGIGSALGDKRLVTSAADKAEALTRQTLRDLHAQVGTETLETIIGAAIGTEAQTADYRIGVNGSLTAIRRWATWLRTDGKQYLGEKADVLRLALLLEDRAIRLQFGDSTGLEKDGLQLMRDAEAIARRGTKDETLTLVMASGATFAALGRIIEIDDKPDDPRAEEYIRKANEYEQHLSKAGSPRQFSPEFLLTTMSVRILPTLGKSDPQAEKVMAAEISRWNRLWLTARHTPATRLGLAFALMLRGGSEDDKGDQPDLRRAISDFSRAEGILQPLRDQMLNSPMPWSVLMPSLELAESYSYLGEQREAIAQLGATLGWLTGHGETRSLLRAVTVKQLAELQERMGAPDSTARLLEESIADLKASKIDQQQTPAPQTSIQVSGTMFSGQIDASMLLRQLLNRLGSYRLKQAEQESKLLPRTRLVSEAGEAYAQILALPDANPQTESTTPWDTLEKEPFPSRIELERVAKECAAYNGAALPVRPHFNGKHRMIPDN